jgi:hypothetical protein
MQRMAGVATYPGFWVRAACAYSKHWLHGIALGVVHTVHQHVLHASMARSNRHHKVSNFVPHLWHKALSGVPATYNAWPACGQGV